jgi:hypothetical protein
MFKAEEVKIYSYWDGEKVAWVDPIEVQINLEAQNPNFQADFKVLFDLVQISNDANAAKEIVRLGRIMFNLKEPRWDDEQQKVIGLTTLGVIRIVLDYINWLGDVKKNIEDMQISLPVMDSSQEEKLDMNVSVDSSSISPDNLPVQ